MLALSIAAATGCTSSSMPGYADYQTCEDAYWRDDYATAFKECKPLADAGDARAQTNLGWMYAEGEGVEQDYKEAIKWFELTAEQGPVAWLKGLARYSIH
jgi:TPR repeat protein